MSVFQTSVIPIGLIAVPLGGAPPARTSLLFTMQHQQQTQWCWAAVTSSVATYYQNAGWSQCRVVSAGLGQGICCSDASSSACNRPWYLDQALQRVGNLGQYTTGALSLTQIQAEIDAGRPVGVRMAWVNGGGHFIILIGYSDQNIVDVQDPWFGRSSVDYQTFRSHYLNGGTWSHSYRTTLQGGQNAATSPQQPKQCA
jgi:hypothetical protein